MKINNCRLLTKIIILIPIIIQKKIIDITNY